MFISTSPEGLYHNMKDWNFEHCGDFKIMEQDYDVALEALKKCDSPELFHKLNNWDFSQGAFKITKNDFKEILKCVQMLIKTTNK